MCFLDKGRRKNREAQPSRLWERWRGFIRAGETGFVAAFVLGALSTSGDMAIAAPLLAAAVIAGVVSIGAEPTLSRKAKVVASAGMSISIILIGAFIFYHFQRQQTVTEAELEPKKSTSTAASRPLKALSNLQLCDAAFDLAKKMRTFESNADFEFHSQMMQPTPREATDEQKQADWNRRIEATLQASSRKRLEFSNNYLAHAQEIRNEITLRLREIGIFPPYVELSRFEQIGPSVLEGGLLAGPQPISAAASYLEKLAQRLPQP
jgi:hypothetical protein